MELGLGVLKFFPAWAAGGVDMLKSIRAPYAHLGMQFIPTGGVSESNMADYLSFDGVLAVGGTWIAKESDLAQERWEEINKRCQSAVIAASQLP